MELRQYLNILKRRWGSALPVVIAVICLGVLGSVLISPKYQAEATLRIATPLGGGSGDTNYQTTFANRLMNTYAEMGTSEQVKQELRAKLGVKSLPVITMKVIPDSEIIRVVAESTDPGLAAKTANALAEVLLSSQQNAAKSEDSKQLSVLADRGEMLQAELAKYQLNHDQLVQAYSQTTAEMGVLDRTIKLKELSYQDLLGQYEQIVVAEDVSPSAANSSRKAALGKEIDRLGKELDSLNQQYKDLSMRSSKYLQQITLLRGTIQNTQSAYADLISRYDSVVLANSKQENAQNIVTVSPAVEPTQQSSPSRFFIFGLGILCALIIGVVAAFVIDYVDPRIYSPEEFRGLTSAPVIGSISKFHDQHGGNRLAETDLVIQRDYWLLRARLQTLIQEGLVKSILVMSPNRGDGKSTITYKLALGLAQNNSKVLVVDADLRMPAQHQLFNVTSKDGLSDFLSGKQDNINGLILRNVRPGIDLLPSLTWSENPIELLQSPRLATLFESLKGYDVVLIDTPAFLAVPDALALSKAVDGVIAVVRCGLTTSNDIQTICSQLESVGSRILGTVVNQTGVQKDLNSYGSEIRRPFRQVKDGIAFLFRMRSTPKTVSPISRGPRPG